MNHASSSWTKLPPLVESIIKARSIAVESPHYIDGKKVGMVKRERSMRFREFAAEIKMDNAQAWRYVRGGVIPNESAQNKIAAWCKRHAKHLKP